LEERLVRQQSILRVVSKLLIPYILLFALYVQFHGDYGPGGGFQAGVIFAAAVILYSLVFGVGAAGRVAPLRLMEKLMALGVLIYAGSGVAAMVRGGNFLDYGALLPHQREHGQHLGIGLVELGVGITVSAVMLSIYYAFARRKGAQ
jgi:multicomponent Na+:H+ antiporter subunit B